NRVAETMWLTSEYADVISGIFFFFYHGVQIPVSDLCYPNTQIFSARKQFTDQYLLKKTITMEIGREIESHSIINKLFYKYGFYNFPL
ncbi:hypothetical protein ACJX0J_035927, partial [Zea mays]